MKASPLLCLTTAASFVLALPTAQAAERDRRFVKTRHETETPQFSKPVPIISATAEAEPMIQTGSYELATLAGAPGTRGHVDGAGPAARFDRPTGIVADAQGNAYVAEETLCTIRKISPDGMVTTLAGIAGQSGSQDGTGSAARFNQPRGLAVDLAGNVFVADIQNQTVRKISPAGEVTTIAGAPGVAGRIDGAREVARLHTPAYVAVDDAGNVFVTQDRAIRQIAPDGTVSTLRVLLYPYSGASGTHDYFYASPWQVCVDHTGNLYAIYSDAWDFSDVVKLTRNSVGEYVGQTLQPPSFQTWASGVGVDDAGNVYVKYDRDPVCRFSPDGGILICSSTDATGGLWWDNFAVDGLGVLYVVPNHPTGGLVGTIDIGVCKPGGTPPVILTQPVGRSVIRGDSVQFSVAAAGAGALTYQWKLNSVPIPGATGPTLTLSNAQTGDAGQYSVVVTSGSESTVSRNAALNVLAPPPPPPPPPTGKKKKSSGGGSFEHGSSLAVLLLLGAALRRRSAQASAIVIAENDGIEARP